MSRFRRMPLLWITGVALLGLAATLAGCGRKGPLEPPPSAAVEPVPPTAAADPVAATWGAPAPPATRPNEAIVRAAPAAKQRSVLDLLLD